MWFSAFKQMGERLLDSSQSQKLSNITFQEILIPGNFCVVQKQNLLIMHFKWRHFCEVCLNLRNNHYTYETISGIISYGHQKNFRCLHWNSNRPWPSWCSTLNNSNIFFYPTTSCHLKINPLSEGMCQYKKFNVALLCFTLHFNSL